MTGAEAASIITYIGACFSRELRDEELAVWGETLTKLENESAWDAARMCKREFDRMPSHHQFTECYRAVCAREVPQLTAGPRDPVSNERSLELVRQLREHIGGRPIVKRA